MTELVLYYLIYNIVTGILLWVPYFLQNDYSVPWRSVALLVVFPAVGLGKCKFIEKIKKGETVEMPQKWFVYKYMTRVNAGYWFIIAAFMLWFFTSDRSNYNAFLSENEGTFTYALSLIASMVGSLFSEYIFMVSAFILLVLFVPLLFFPLYMVKKTEADFFRRKCVGY